MGILQYNAKGTAKVGFTNFIHVNAIVADLTVLDIVETVNQVGNGGFSCSGGADKCNLLSRCRVEHNVVQYDFFISITEIHIVKNHIAGEFRISGGVICFMIMFPRP